jgi:hypothetical protein
MVLTESTFIEFRTLKVDSANQWGHYRRHYVVEVPDTLEGVQVLYFD